VLGSVGGRSVDTSSSSIQSDLGPGAGKVGGEEIDPIAEADVYMAYGRDAQAEEILKDALAKDSSRQALRVKLLEIYANRKDTRAFETVANELHTATGGRGADWEKAAALGLSIDPTKALYGGKPGGSFTAAPSQLPPGFNETAQMPAFNPPTTAAPAMDSEAPLNIDFDIGTATTAGAALPDLDLGIASAPSAGPAAGLDFDLGLGGDKTGGGALAGAAPASAAAEPPLSIDFDLPMGDKPAQAASAAPPVAAPATELAAIDFNLGTQAGGPKAEAPKAPAVDLASISLDLGAPGGGNGSGGAPDSRWQEVATKLDLAKAYEEMGDKDGARELLKEVVKEGDTAQQQQAQTMLQALG
jgi:pilus assembly protein FimV